MGKKSSSKSSKVASPPSVVAVAAAIDASFSTAAAAEDRRSSVKSSSASELLERVLSDRVTDQDLVQALSHQIQQSQLAPHVEEMIEGLVGTELSGDLVSCDVICECVRSFAAAVLAFLTDRFLHGSTNDDCLTYRPRRLMDELAALPEAFRAQLGVMLQLDPRAPLGVVGATFMAVGAFVAMFAMPPAVSARVAKALGLTPPRGADADVCREAFAQAIALRLVPAATAPLPVEMLVKTIVEETIPGRFVCTVDNAKLMCLLPRTCSTSERFIFAKAPWRISLHTKDERISLTMWHRSTQTVAVRVSLTIEDIDAKPKRVRRSSITQTIEGQWMASDPIAFEGVLTLAEFANKSSKVYNAVEDRLTFTLELESMPVTKAATLEDLVAEEEREKQRKALQKNRQKIEKKVKLLETSESQDREKIIAASLVAQQSLDAEARRMKSQPAKQKKEREKRPADEVETETAIEPDLEMEAQVMQLQKMIQTARSAVSKLNNERHKEDKELQRLRTAVAEKQSEVDQLESSKTEMSETMSNLQAEVAKLQERKQWLDERKRQCEEHKRTMAFAIDPQPLPPPPLVQPQHVSAPFTGFQWSEKPPTTTTPHSQSQPIVVENMGTPAGSFHIPSPRAAAVPVVQPPPPRRMIPPPRTVQHQTTPPSRQTSQTFTAVPLPRSSELRAQASPPLPAPSPSPAGGFLPTQSPFGWSAFQ